MSQEPWMEELKKIKKRCNDGERFPMIEVCRILTTQIELAEKRGQDKIRRELAVALKEQSMRNEQGDWILLLSDRLAQELFALTNHNSPTQ